MDFDLADIFCFIIWVPVYHPYEHIILNILSYRAMKFLTIMFKICSDIPTFVWKFSFVMSLKIEVCWEHRLKKKSREESVTVGATTQWAYVNIFLIVIASTVARAFITSNGIHFNQHEIPMKSGLFLTCLMHLNSKSGDFIV